MKILLGLGNPGAAYAGTRHNAGKIILSHIASLLNLEWSTAGFGKYTLIQGPSPTALCLPAGYMNTCGPAVKLALRHFQITEKENIFVVHDEMEMKIGRWRPVESGLSLHGHNGLKSIERSLQGRDRFQRVKIGIGRPLSHDQQDVSDYVLGKFSEQELDTLRALAK